jgi:hypothetical protein
MIEKRLTESRVYFENNEIIVGKILLHFLQVDRLPDGPCFSYNITIRRKRPDFLLGTKIVVDTLLFDGTRWTAGIHDGHLKGYVWVHSPEGFYKWRFSDTGWT